MDAEQLLKIPPRSLSEVFLETDAAPGNGELALTPFMRHISECAGLTARDLEDPRRTWEFVLWLYDTAHRLRAPYQWPVPPRVLDWANATAIWCHEDERLYLTRFMEHVRSRHRNCDVSSRSGCLEFLTWFAYECVPTWNLPRQFVPDGLVAILNEPAAGCAAPLTAGMWLRAQAMLPELKQADPVPDRAALTAASFRVITELLAGGDPRLLPEFVTEYWYGCAVPESSLTRYEYLAARAFAGPESASEEHVKSWFLQYSVATPGAEVFAGANSGVGSLAETRPIPRAIFVYRDWQTECGIARAGKTGLEVLRRAEVPVIDIDFRLSRERVIDEYRNNEGRFYDTTRALQMLMLNPEYVPDCLACHASKIAESDYFIGQFYWELSDIGAGHECALSLVDEIWVASEYLRDVYARRVSAPVFVMGQAVEIAPLQAPLTRSAFGLPENSYLFLMVFDAGSVLERKNPLAAVNAFRAAFPGGEKAALVIKTMNTAALQTAGQRKHWRAVLDAAEADPRIRILDEMMSPAELAALNELCDCYVSLHRSEGFGFGPAEAMARGKPVIATAYSGTADFCTEKTALPVDFTLREVEPGTYPYMHPDRTYYWAEPNCLTAAQHMHALFAAPGRGRELGRRAQAFMRERYSVDALWERYRARLSTLGFLEH